MHIGTNDKKATLTRPVAMWKRVFAGLGGSVAVLVALGALGNGEGWVALLPLGFGVGCFIFAATKYETIG